MCLYIYLSCLVKVQPSVTMDKLKGLIIKSEKEIQFEDFLKILAKFNKVFGVGRAKPPTTTKLASLVENLRQIYYFAARFTLVLSCLLYMLWMVFHHETPHEVLRVLPNIANNVFIAGKFFVLFFNFDKIHGMLVKLRRIFNTLKTESAQVIREYYVTSYIFQWINAVLFPIVWTLQAIEFAANYFMYGTKIFTVQIWLPFGHETGFGYFASCLSVWWSAVMMCSGLFIADWLLYIIVTLISIDFELVGVKLKEILSNPQAQIKELKTVVDIHNELMEICDGLENIVSHSLLLNRLLTTFVICFLCFQLAVLEDFSQLAIYALVLLLVFVQLFLTCFHGQMMIDASSKVAAYIQQSNWHSIEDLRVKKMIPMMIMISQKPKKLTTSGYSVISMELFTNVRFR